MFYKVKKLKDYSLDCIDGEVGKVKEFYFDDQHWTIRYLVADTGNWLMERKVLISPYALGCVDRQAHHITVSLTKKQIQESPSLKSDMPVSQQFEEAYYGYYGWPIYWNGSNIWGNFNNLVRDPGKWGVSNLANKPWNPHLRSTQDVTGHHIQANDGEIGHVQDFIIDNNSWTIRYLVIDISNWLPGKKVLISPQWINRVSWAESKVFINLVKEAIKFAPEYSEETVLSRIYENKLHEHYKAKVYWLGEPVKMHEMD